MAAATPTIAGTTRGSEDPPLPEVLAGAAAVLAGAAVDAGATVVVTCVGDDSEPQTSSVTVCSAGR